MTPIHTINFLFIFFALGCREDRATPPQTTSVSTPTLSGSWRAVKVIQDQTDVSANFSAFTISIANPPAGTSTFAFIVKGNSGVTAWPKSGTFTSGGSGTITRDDQTVLVYKLNGDSLQFNFDYKGAGFLNRSLAGVDGSWKMFFVIQ